MPINHPRIVTSLSDFMVVVESTTESNCKTNFINVSSNFKHSFLAAAAGVMLVVVHKNRFTGITFTDKFTT